MALLASVPSNLSRSDGLRPLDLLHVDSLLVHLPERAHLPKSVDALFENIHQVENLRLGRESAVLSGIFWISAQNKERVNDCGGN